MGGLPRRKPRPPCGNSTRNVPSEREPRSAAGRPKATTAFRLFASAVPARPVIGSPLSCLNSRALLGFTRCVRWKMARPREDDLMGEISLSHFFIDLISDFLRISCLTPAIDEQNRIACSNCLGIRECILWLVCFLMLLPCFLRLQLLALKSLHCFGHSDMRPNSYSTDPPVRTFLIIQTLSEIVISI